MIHILKKNMNACKPSEHQPNQEEIVIKTLRGNIGCRADSCGNEKLKLKYPKYFFLFFFQSYGSEIRPDSYREIRESVS